MLRQLEFRDRLVAMAAVPLLVVAVVAAGLLLFIDSPGTTAYGLFALVGLIAAGGWVYLVGSALVSSIDELTASTSALAEAQTKLAGGELEPEDLPTVEVAGDAQLARLAGSINTVSTAAATATEKQRGAVKAGLSTIVVNLARRSQTLLDRQVEYLDKLESSEEDPERLGELFKVDHLATRMRRNAESLLVLAEAEPGRRRGAPVEIGDVLRVAMGEVENYQHIELGTVADGQVSAGAAVDLAHLMAELMENATQFSPPNTPVEVTGGRPKGGSNYVVSIADGGMGLGDKLDGANELLANPPELGLGMGRSLGFMVIGRLARRLGATVNLQPNGGGGTVATVSIPTSLFRETSAPATKRKPRGKGKRKNKTQEAGATAAVKADQVPEIAESAADPEPAPSPEPVEQPEVKPAAASTTLEKLLGLSPDALADDPVDAAPADWASTSPFGENAESGTGEQADGAATDVPSDDGDAVGAVEGGAVEGAAAESSGSDQEEGEGSDASAWVPPAVTPVGPAQLSDAVPSGEAFEDGVASLLEKPDESSGRSRSLRDGDATSAGLKKRERGASKVPIGEGRPVAAPNRNPDEVRSMLSRYREGLKGGKQDAREDADGSEPVSGDATGKQKAGRNDE